MYQSFNALKKALILNQVLASPDPTRPFVLQTYTSGIGIGSILSQTTNEGIDRPVAYNSRKLLPQQRRYSATEQECLAMVDGVRHFHFYLTGCSQFSDRPQQVTQFLDSRLTCWAQLQDYSPTWQM